MWSVHGGRIVSRAIAAPKLGSKFWHDPASSQHRVSHHRRLRLIEAPKTSIAIIFSSTNLKCTISSACMMNSFAPPFPQPASAWQEHKTPEGRAYYYNNATKVTQWTKPEDMMSTAEVSCLFLV